MLLRNTLISRAFREFSNSNAKSFDTSLLKYFGCPLSKGPLKFDPVSHELISPSLALAFPVDIQGTPDLLPNSARKLSDKEVEILVLSGVVSRDELSADKVHLADDYEEKGE
eukprot:g6172.t1